MSDVKSLGRWSDEASFWLEDGAATIVSDELAQAIIRSHPDVLAAVRMLREVEWVQGFFEGSGRMYWSCPICEAEACETGTARGVVGKHEDGCELAAALTPWEEANG